MARHRKLTQKFAGFPIFKVGTSGDTFPVTSPFTTGFTGYGDGLSLDLQFATDKTLTARKGPTPVFTRGSSATQVGASGLIEYAPENEYQRSQEFNDGFWTKSNSSVTANAATAPDGTLTAAKLVENAAASVLHSVQSSALFSNGGRQTLSIFAKKGERDFIVLRSFAVDYFFNLNTGVAITAGGTITDQGNGWYRCSVTTNTGIQSQIRMSADGVTSTYTGDGVSGIFIWGAQLERSSTARTYIPTTTAAVYGARFDHDPLTLACKGLLIEEQRVNNLTQSGSMNLWNGVAGSTRTISTLDSPEGVSKATLGSSSSNAFGGIVARSLSSLTSVAGTQYVASCFVKKDNWRYVAIDYTPIRPSSSQVPFFDLDTLAFNANGSATTGSIVLFPNGWYRISVSGAALSSISGSVDLILTSSTGSNGAVIGAGNNVHIWGAQLEAGSFPTSYIPTTTGPVTRSADVCSITGSDFTGMYNNTEGSVISQGSIENLVGNNRGMWGINNNTGSHGFLTLYGASGGGIVSQSRNTTATALPPTFANSASTSFKRGLTYYSGGASISTNGATATDTVVTNSTQTMLTLQIGNMLAGAFYWSGHIASIRYFKKRLANAKLQTLTV